MNHHIFFTGDDMTQSHVIKLPFLTIIKKSFVKFQLIFEYFKHVYPVTKRYWKLNDEMKLTSSTGPQFNLI
jgi:hypothetical protein